MIEKLGTHTKTTGSQSRSALANALSFLHRASIYTVQGTKVCLGGPRDSLRGNQ